jgi:hypothetical protein
MLLTTILAMAACLSYSDFIKAMEEDGCPQKLSGCTVQQDPDCEKSLIERDLCLMLNNCTTSQSLDRAEYD